MTIMVLIKEKIPNNSTTSLFKHRVQNVLEKKFILSNNITLSWIYKFFFSWIRPSYILVQWLFIILVNRV